MTRAREEAAQVRGIRGLQERLRDSLGMLPASASSVYVNLISIARRAITSDVLITSPYDLQRLIKLSEPTRANDGHLVYAIAGGPKDFTRLQAGIEPSTRLVREDSAVIHFSLTLKERPEQPVELVAYNFEIYFPSREPLEFIRFDLNFHGTDNDDLGLRCHMHPNHEDIQIPSAILTPDEILYFLLYRCRPRRDAARTRT